MAEGETKINFHIINVFGLAGNILAALCIVKSPKLKSLTYNLVGSLIVIDLLSSLQFTLNSCFGPLSDFKFTCVSNIFCSTLLLSSVYILVAVAFHHLIGFASTEHLKKTTATIWISSFLIALAYTYFCIYTSHIGDGTSAIIWTLLTYLFPLMQILLIFCCVKIGRNHRIPAAPKSIEENAKQDATTTMVFALIALYFCLSLPFHFQNMKLALFPETLGKTEEFFIPFGLCIDLADLHFLIRPIPYFLLYEEQFDGNIGLSENGNQDNRKSNKDEGDTLMY